MKSNVLALKQAVTRFISDDSFLPLLIGFLILVASIIGLSSCKNEEEISVDVQKLVGTYAVEETGHYDEIENYSITISKSKADGANVEFSTFGGFMYTPVKGTILGDKLTIPHQSFESPYTIALAGDGVLKGDTLIYQYSLEYGGDTFKSTCVAVKQ